MMTIDPEKLLSRIIPGRIGKFLKQPESTDNGLPYWRERIVFTIYAIFILLGFIVIIPSVYLAIHAKEWWIVFIDIAAYAAILIIFFSRKPSFTFRATSLFILLYIIGVALMINIAAEYALIWLFAIAILAAVVLGLKASCIALGVNLATLVVAGFLINNGTVTWDSTAPSPVAGWIVVSFNFMLLNTIAAMSIAVLVEKLKSSLEQEQNAGHRLLEQHILLQQEIEQRQNAEQEKQRLREKLQQAQKMEAIGTLAGGIAHDFNNLLHAILGYTSLAQFNLPEKSKTRDNLDNVLIAANRAKELIAQILAFSRQTESKPIILQAQTIIKEGIKLLRSSIPTTITIKTNIDPECGSIMADPTQLQQVVMNLCTNAFQAMEKTGGILTITLEETVLTRELIIEETDLSPGPYLKLQISDTGPGIDPAIQQRIFEPYFTTKAVGKGTGMGLAMVHGIVKKHGGIIRCENNLKQGTSFSLFFPLIATDEKMKKHHNEELDITGTERILFVDDEELLAEMGREMLEQLGYTVTTTTDSSVALDLFRATPDRFDLLITDQTMPLLTGGDLAREILNIRPDLPIILCTGYSSVMSPEIATAIGIRGFLRKPIVLQELARSIRELLSRGTS